MPFHSEPDGYAKTAWSDCQGAWENLRESVVNHHPFLESQRLLFHVDEGMSWESVRDVERMRRALTLVENIAKQVKAPADVMESLVGVRESFQELLEAITEGEA
jgi:hypothetical protein